MIKIYPDHPINQKIRVAESPSKEESSCGCSSSENYSSTFEINNYLNKPITSILLIEQMDCPVEQRMIVNKLSSLDGIKQLHFNLLNRTLTITHDEKLLDDIISAIQSLGFTAVIFNEDARSQQTSSASTSTSKNKLIKVCLSIVLAAIAEILHWNHQPEWIIAIFAIVSVIIGGFHTYKKGVISLKAKDLNINALMSIAVTGAIILRQWPEAAMVMALFNLAEIIEDKSLLHAKNAIQSLMLLTPDNAIVKQKNGEWKSVPSNTVVIGDIILVKPGERVPLDGTITQGQTLVNQAPITGESIPVEKTVNDNVFAGSINQINAFEFTATESVKNSTLSRIIKSIEKAQQNKAPIERFIDQFARIYTPCVFIIAFAVAIIPPLVHLGSWYDWVYRALTLLIIACPCALVISTPITVVSALANAARKGILIKGGAYFEKSRNLNWLALDKTGTITEGKPKQTDFIILNNNISADECLSIAGSLAALSTHPVSQAIETANQFHPLPINNFKTLLGIGSQGELNNETYYLINYRYISTLGLNNDSLFENVTALEKQGKTVVLLTNKTHVLALFAVADTIKASSKEAIKQLHNLGVNTIILTGDNPHTATIIANEVNITEIRGNQMPEDKLAEIEKLCQKNVVGMVGDGINDGPALARADIGFAMGGVGSDTAIETADVTIMDDDLQKIPRLIKLSKTTHIILIENIVIALGIKLIFFVLTLLGVSSMWMAVFADVGTSLIVIINGLRLLKK